MSKDDKLDLILSELSGIKTEIVDINNTLNRHEGKLDVILSRTADNTERIAALEKQQYKQEVDIDIIKRAIFNS